MLMSKVYDVLVIGSGAAGYSAADWLFKENITDIAVVTENRFSGTSRNTGSDKQTYYKLSMDGRAQDSAEKMACDMFSGGSADGEKAYIQAVNSVKCFLRLCDYGVPFPTDSFGGYPGYKTDHDDTTRATSAGPLTSKMMTQCLEDKVLNKNKTELLDNRQVIKIVTDENGVCGVIVLNTKTGKLEAVAAKNIIAACGAPACIYERSVYPPSQHGMTGVLLEAGVRLCNYSQWQYGLASVDFRWNVSGSFMQVIPRFVSVDESGNEYEFLPDYFESEKAANSAVFLKGYQWPFCYERADASSKVDIAVHEQINMGRAVYLDYTKNPVGYSPESLSEEVYEYLSKTACFADTPIQRLQKLNPKAIAVYARHGIDISRDKLRIAVCAQHNNGGVYTDSNYMSDVEGLYVIGEAAGSFGLVRPGGSALNDTQVGGLVCAKHIKNSFDRKINIDTLKAALYEQKELVKDFVADEKTNYTYITRKMSNCAAFIRKKEECEALLCEIRQLLSCYPFKHKSLSDYYYDKDMLLSAKALLETVLAEMPLTGSRVGAVFTQNGKTAQENKEYRKYITVTENSAVSFQPTAPVPQVDKPFEYYLLKVKENEN